LSACVAADPIPRTDLAAESADAANAACPARRRRTSTSLLATVERLGELGDDRPSERVADGGGAPVGAPGDLLERRPELGLGG
jgi:hypothetical protein